VVKPQNNTFSTDRFLPNFYMTTFTREKLEETDLFSQYFLFLLNNLSESLNNIL